MNNSQYSITIYIAGVGTPLNDGSWKDVQYATTDDKGNEIYYMQGEGNTSTFGHIWFSLDGGEKGQLYYGFGPEVHNDPFGKGHVFPDDNKAYAFTKYQESYPLTKEQYFKIKKFAEGAANNNTFGDYNGLTNACVDFCFAALREGEVFTDETLPVPRDGSLLPSMNIPNLKAIKSAYMKNWNAGPGQDRNLNDVQPLNSIGREFVADRQEISHEESIKVSGAKSSFYVIQPGDTLGAIAVNNDVSVTSILANNPQISDADHIQADEVLYIPDKSVKTMQINDSILDGLSLFQDDTYVAKLSNPFKDQLGPKEKIVLEIGSWLYNTERVSNEQEIQTGDN